MSIQDVAGLITIRNFLVGSIDNLNIKLTREEIKNVQTRVVYLDKTIVEHALKLDLTKMGREDILVRKWESTEDVKDVADRLHTKTEKLEEPETK
jgi:hypothetical protein